MEFSKGQFVLNYKRNFLRARSMRLQRGPPREEDAAAGVVSALAPVHKGE